MWRDLRIAARSLARRPGFTAVALLTLGLGFGGTTAVFTVVNAVLLSALPYEDAERLVVVGGTRRREGKVESGLNSYLDVVDWRQQNQVFEDLVVSSSPEPVSLEADGEPTHVRAELVSAGYFRLLGIRPAVGRAFSREEDSPAGTRTLAILSDHFWRQNFGSDPDLDRLSLILNGESFQVVGVAPPGFRGVTDQADLWVPVAMASSLKERFYLERRSVHWLSALAKLRPGVTIERAQAEMDTLAAALEAQYPRSNHGVGVELTPIREAWIRDYRTGLWTLLAGAGFVLLIAATNIANLLLARTFARQRDLAIGAALGAGRWSLLRGLLIESSLLAGLGGLLGLLVARWATGLLVAASDVNFRSYVEIAVAPRVVAATLAVAVVCGIGVGLAPSWMASQIRLSEALKEGGRGLMGSRRHRLQSLLVVVEVAVAFVLFVGVALAVRGFQELRTTDLGFTSRDLMTFRVSLQNRSYAAFTAKAQVTARLFERLGGLPSVAAAELAGPTVPPDGWAGARYTIEDRRETGAEDLVLMKINHVSPGYFDLLGVPLLAGRSFDERDFLGSPLVVLVSEGAVERFWEGRSPLGKRLKFGTRESPNSWKTVVGVVGDLSESGFENGDEHDHPYLYYPVLQEPPSTPPLLNGLLRANGEAGPQLETAVRTAVRSVAPELAVYDFEPLAARLDRQLAGRRFLVLLLGLFTGVALVLATVGIYGVLAYVVAEGERELGVRLALGASRRQIFFKVLVHAAMRVAAGLAAGLAAVLALTRLLASRIPDLPASDPWALAAATLLLSAVGLAAGVVPAWRAARIDPKVILRSE